MRLAIVNDMPLAIEALRRVVTSVAGYQVAWTAGNGAEAVKQCSTDVPDLVLMDLIMPVMNGAEATRHIMRATPCVILVVTSTVEGNAGLVFEAMGHGALDAVCTPTLAPGGGVRGGEELLKKIATVARLAGFSAPSHASKAHASAPPAVAVTADVPVLAVGASTGGPRALVTLFSSLPRPLPVAAVIIQHVDEQFSSGLADWLAEQTGHPVRLARPGDRLETGVVLLAGTNDHLVLEADQSLRYTPEPRHYPYRPSVDAFFRSLGEHQSRPGVAVLLTGMGRDGAEGLLELRRRRWHTIAQDKETSCIYGMPRAAAEIGAAADILPLERIAPAITAQLGRQ